MDEQAGGKEVCRNNARPDNDVGLGQARERRVSPRLGPGRGKSVTVATGLCMKHGSTDTKGAGRT